MSSMRNVGRAEMRKGNLLPKFCLLLLFLFQVLVDSVPLVATTCFLCCSVKKIQTPKSRLFTQVSSFLALAVTVAAEVVKIMVAKGYVLGQRCINQGDLSKQ